MKRFLNPASKALAVVGVLMLMWTASEIKPAQADVPVPVCRVIRITIDGDATWITCTNGILCPPTQTCVINHKPRYIIADDWYTCCTVGGV